jgi:hypothetical protein
MQHSCRQRNDDFDARNEGEIGLLLLIFQYFNAGFLPALPAAGFTRV